MNAAGGTESQRRRRREAYGCPCDGRSHLKLGRIKDARVDMSAQYMAAVTGHRPIECPWSSLDHPLVRDVIRLQSVIDSRLVKSYFASLSDMPNVLREGLVLFVNTFEACLTERRERERKERERQREMEAKARNRR